MPLFQSETELLSLAMPESVGLGTHVLADFFECNNVPENAEQLERCMLRAAELIQATVVSSTFHQFNPIGLSGVVVIAESHIAAHTWPEHNTICVDFFTCSANMNSLPGIAWLYTQFQTGRVKVEFSERGR